VVDVPMKKSGGGKSPDSAWIEEKRDFPTHPEGSRRKRWNEKCPIKGGVGTTFSKE